MRLCSFEDGVAAKLDPLTLTRAAMTLRCGARSLWERQADYFAATECGAWVREDVRALTALALPDFAVNDAGFGVDYPVVLCNARWLAPPPEPTPLPAAPQIGMVDGEIAFVMLPHGLPTEWHTRIAHHLELWRMSLPQREVGGRLLDRPLDLIQANTAALSEDLWRWQAVEGIAEDRGARILGPRDQCYIAPTAEVEPNVIIDTRPGPVLIDREAVVESFSRLQGPCYIGPGSRILGARIEGSSLGPQCRVGGEVQDSILHGYVNKCHDGFLGHSYLGEWVNFGAGTQTSDLRNDYEEITMSVAGTMEHTGCLKLGSFVGDYTRTGIGTLLNVGSSVGPFCELLPSGSLLPRRIPAFCQFGHGQLRPRTDLRRVMSAAGRAMERRGCAWTGTHSDAAFDLYERTEAERQHVLQEVEQRQWRRSA